jgi:hypothetical protein
MKKTSSPLQVVLGCALGVLLQPVSLWIVLNHLTSARPPKDWGLGIFPVIGMYLALLPVPRGPLALPSFGVAQAFTILPAALFMWLAGRYGVVRGLLHTGIALALANIGVMVFVYVGFYSTIS